MANFQSQGRKVTKSSVLEMRKESTIIITFSCCCYYYSFNFLKLLLLFKSRE